METNRMNTQSIIITRLKIQIALVAVLALALPAIVFAHGGEEHVIGTVTKVSDTSVTVKTTAGKIVEVGFDAKTTTYARAKMRAQKTDVKVGDRIVIHAVEVNEKLVAHTVALGAITTASKTK